MKIVISKLCVFIFLVTIDVINGNGVNFTPWKELFQHTIDVELETANKNGIIYYTLDKSDPRKSNTRTSYTKPFKITASITIYATVKRGKRYSEIYKKRYEKLRELLPPKIVIDKKSYDHQNVVLFKKPKSETSDYSVFYTLNGDDPSVNGVAYEGAFAIDSTSTIRYVAIDPTGRFLNSKMMFRNVTFVDSTALLKIIPESKVFKDSLVVTLEYKKYQGGVYYTTDGTVPSEESSPYESEIVIKNDTELSVAMFDNNGNRIVYHNERYSLARERFLVKPTVTPPGGVFVGKIPPITVTHPDSSVIFLYSVNGTKPELGSNLVGKDRVLTVDTESELTIVAYKNSQQYSAPIRHRYTFYKALAPKVSPVNGTVFNDSLIVRLENKNKKLGGTHLYYTTDGRNPLHFGIEYRTPFTITKSTIVKAAVKGEGVKDSDIIVRHYYGANRPQNAYYKDIDGNNKIDCAVIEFGEKIKTIPKEILFHDPFDENTTFYANSKYIGFNEDSTGLVIAIEEIFRKKRKFIPGFFAQIPYPGDYDTQPFLVSDSTYAVAVDKEKYFNIYNEYFSGKSIALINSPYPLSQSISVPTAFAKGKDNVSGIVIALIVEYGDVGIIQIENKGGNTIISSQEMMSLGKTGIRYFLWEIKKNEKLPIGKYRVHTSIVKKIGSPIVDNYFFVDIKE